MTYTEVHRLSDISLDANFFSVLRGSHARAQPEAAHKADVILVSTGGGYLLN